MLKLIRKVQIRLGNANTSTLDSVSAYALWAQSYPAEAHNVLMQIEQEQMLALMPPLQGMTVLDLACGTGRYGKIAGELGANQVLGFDNSAAMLEQSVIPHVALASSEQIPVADSSIDIVLCGLALGHLPQLKPSIQEISRILKPNGIALISDFHPYQFLSGAQRTFKANNTTFAVEHHVHHISDYYAIGNTNHLKLTAIKEPCYQGNVPVVLILCYQKLEG